MWATCVKNINQSLAEISFRCWNRALGSTFEHLLVSPSITILTLRLRGTPRHGQPYRVQCRTVGGRSVALNTSRLRRWRGCRESRQTGRPVTHNYPQLHCSRFNELPQARFLGHRHKLPAKYIPASRVLDSALSVYTAKSTLRTGAGSHVTVKLMVLSTLQDLSCVT